jgi:hypothetical protein
VTIGALHDTNVSVTSPDPSGQTPSDSLLRMDPFAQLEFFGPRTTFSSGYRGGLRRYFEFDELNDTDHHAFMTLRHRVSRRVTFFADENYAQLATTDQLELNGIPFARIGSRSNAGSAGVEARLSRTLDLSTRYEMSWADFDGQYSQLTGGIVHGVKSALTHRVGERVSLGGEYGIRWADMNAGARKFTYQDAGAVFGYNAGERTELEIAGGLSHLHNRVLDATRTSPYARFTITHRAARANVGAEIGRSYSPSFFLGGSHLSNQARAYIDVPFSRNRFYVQESASWRSTDPVLASQAPLDTLWLRSALGYAIQRWVRVEGYHVFTGQDNQVAGGRITRHLAGIQVVISEPMRIR